MIFLNPRLSSLVESHTTDNLHACARRCRMLLPHKWFSYKPSTSTCLCAPYLYTDTRVDGEDIFVEDAGSVLYVSAGQYAVSIRSSVHTTDICASGVLIFANIYVISQIR